MDTQQAYDVLIYISDQHTATCSGFMGDGIANTPHLDAIAGESAVFKSAYTTCPLCVPARASFLTSRFPSNIGVFNNTSEFKAQEVTFAHLHDMAGYDSNLIGRMHFVGMDFYHGFTRRFGKDISNSYWGYDAEKREDWGDFGRSLSQIHCLEVIGEGNSPVLEYDNQVVAQALEFYQQDHEKPQMTVVGTYSPHFPYMCEQERMDKFEARIRESFAQDPYTCGESPAKAKVQTATDDDVIKLRAAYYAMIERMDEQIGQVYDAYQQYLQRTGKCGIFIYMSDHGDQIGYHQMYGKQTFFEKSAQIPLVVQMPEKTASVISAPVNIMDIGPTLCQLNATPAYPVSDGHSFAGLLQGDKEPQRYAISEFYDAKKAGVLRGYMIRQGDEKLITYVGHEAHDLLYNLADDPEEHNNLAQTNPERVAELRKLLLEDARVANHETACTNSVRNAALLYQYGADHTQLNTFTTQNPTHVRYVPDHAKREFRN